MEDWTNFGSGTTTSTGDFTSSGTITFTDGTSATDSILWTTDDGINIGSLTNPMEDLMDEIEKLKKRIKVLEDINKSSTDEFSELREMIDNDE